MLRMQWHNIQKSLEIILEMLKEHLRRSCRRNRLAPPRQRILAPCAPRSSASARRPRRRGPSRRGHPASCAADRQLRTGQSLQKKERAKKFGNFHPIANHSWKGTAFVPSVRACQYVLVCAQQVNSNVPLEFPQESFFLCHFRLTLRCGVR